ncbi:histidine phosphatase family protein [Virgibacillus profundi]|uniref:Histidine phosphatase family protein n=1 Tax=Virgibacillus profundi TaxID=2024555 RepID=A0A2A2I9Y1_9BACI|nr:histidine phosphatase family protein [Virgibacillus profundi]PAV28447.1 histidine phosphatase family protein [Virgibacillus profundi]PXY52620.1 histidine phosphatase family protein [Virgibacillus profundi]
MTTICLIRHGETDWNAAGRLQGKTDIPLNTTGMKQAEACSTYLTSSSYDVLITSPLKRARQTAEIINNLLHLPFVVMEDFAERYFGDGEGMTYDERRMAFPDKNYPKQEETEDFLNRIMTGLKKINQSYPDQKVLLVAHGAVIKAILAAFSEDDTLIPQNRLMNGCISNIHFENEKWNVKDFNRTEHLNKLF